MLIFTALTAILAVFFAGGQCAYAGGTGICACERSACLGGQRAYAQAEPYQAALSAAAKSANDIYVSLNIAGDTYRFEGKDIEFSPSLDAQLARALALDGRGRIVSFDKKYKFSFALKAIDQKLRQLYDKYYLAPVNSTPSFSPDAAKMFSCTPSVPGLRLDIERLRGEICAALEGGRPYEGRAVPEKFEGSLSREKVKKSFALRAQFSTDMSASIAERKHNIALSASKLSGVMLYPGDSFSFNAATGARTEQNGYKMAKVISGGKLIEGMGGGVCQTSTTLYNALLLSDLKVTQSQSHSLLIGYVPPSFDAMVNSGWADLRFENNTDNMIYIRAITTDNNIKIEIYGQPHGYTIKRRSQRLEEIPAPPEDIVDDPLFAGKVTYADEIFIISPSKAGLKSRAFLDYFNSDGSLAKTVDLRSDYYAPARGTAVRGKLKRPAA